MSLQPAIPCPRCGAPLVDLDGPPPEPEPPAPICVLVDRDHYECKLCTCKPGDQYSCYEFPRVISEPTATPLQLADRTLDCAERRRRIRTSSLNIRIHSRQEMDWLADASRVAKLVAEGNKDLAPLFWIRLYGVIHEIYERLSASSAFAVQNGASPPGSIVDFLEAIRNLVALFSDDELIYIQYRRDVECHPLQLNYEVRVKKNGELREAFDRKFLGQKIPTGIEDFFAAAKRVLTTAASEVELARVFAERCLLALADVKRKGALIYG